MNKNLKVQIIELRNQDKTYDQIADLLDCSKSTVCYHLGIGQKEKYATRRISNRAKQHPYGKKLEGFKSRNHNPTIFNYPNRCQTNKLIYHKIRRFFRDRKTNQVNDVTFTVQDIINKFGENPVCYLTGTPINIYQPRTYQFDHIVPISRGGDNSIENLGICTKLANLAKTNMTHQEFIQLCKQVVDYHKNS